MTRIDDNLERALSDLTSPEEREATLWREAQERAKDERAWTRSIRKHKPVYEYIAAGLVVVLMIVGLIVIVQPDLGKARQSARRLHAPTGSEIDPTVPAPLDEPNASAVAPFGAGRMVARRVEIELTTPDVAAAFARVNHLLSPASGEYVESSSLAGEGAGANGQLAMRIAASRLDEFLNELRGVARVVREAGAAEDVTDRVVDLDARLRNTQRIEDELLKLLAGRENADLDDIMAVRARLDDVRLEVERLTAQRDQLGSLVALARVLVIIRHQDADLSPRTSGTALSRAVEQGWDGLVSSIGWVIQVLISGALWWLVLAGAMVMAVRISRKSSIIR